MQVGGSKESVVYMMDVSPSPPAPRHAVPGQRGGFGGDDERDTHDGHEPAHQSSPVVDSKVVERMPWELVVSENSCEHLRDALRSAHGTRIADNVLKIKDTCACVESVACLVAVASEEAYTRNSMDERERAAISADVATAALRRAVSTAAAMTTTVSHSSMRQGDGTASSLEPFHLALCIFCSLRVRRDEMELSTNGAGSTSSVRKLVTIVEMLMRLCHVENSAVLSAADRMHLAFVLRCRLSSLSRRKMVLQLRKQQRARSLLSSSSPPPAPPLPDAMRTGSLHDNGNGNDNDEDDEVLKSLEDLYVRIAQHAESGGAGDIVDDAAAGCLCSPSLRHPLEYLCVDAVTPVVRSLMCTRYALVSTNSTARTRFQASMKMRATCMQYGRDERSVAILAAGLADLIFVEAAVATAAVHGNNGNTTSLPFSGDGDDENDDAFLGDCFVDFIRQLPGIREWTENDEEERHGPRATLAAIASAAPVLVRGMSRGTCHVPAAIKVITLFAAASDAVMTDDESYGSPVNSARFFNISQKQLEEVVERQPSYLPWLLKLLDANELSLAGLMETLRCRTHPSETALRLVAAALDATAALLACGHADVSSPHESAAWEARAEPLMAVALMAGLSDKVFTDIFSPMAPRQPRHSHRLFEWFCHGLDDRLNLLGDESRYASIIESFCLRAARCISSSSSRCSIGEDSTSPALEGMFLTSSSGRAISKLVSKLAGLRSRRIWDAAVVKREGRTGLTIAALETSGGAGPPPSKRPKTVHTNGHGSIDDAVNMKRGLVHLERCLSNTLAEQSGAGTEGLFLRDETMRTSNGHSVEIGNVASCDQDHGSDSRHRASAVLSRLSSALRVIEDIAADVTWSSSERCDELTAIFQEGPELAGAIIAGLSRPYHRGSRRWPTYGDETRLRIVAYIAAAISRVSGESCSEAALGVCRSIMLVTASNRHGNEYECDKYGNNEDDDNGGSRLTTTDDRVGKVHLIVCVILLRNRRFDAMYNTSRCMMAQWMETQSSLALWATVLTLITFSMCSAHSMRRSHVVDRRLLNIREVVDTMGPALHASIVRKAIETALTIGARLKPEAVLSVCSCAGIIDVDSIIADTKGVMTGHTIVADILQSDVSADRAHVRVLTSPHWQTQAAMATSAAELVSMMTWEIERCGNMAMSTILWALANVHGFHEHVLRILLTDDISDDLLDVCDLKRLILACACRNSPRTRSTHARTEDEEEDDLLSRNKRSSLVCRLAAIGRRCVVSLKKSSLSPPMRSDEKSTATTRTFAIECKRLCFVLGLLDDLCMEHSLSAGDAIAATDIATTVMQCLKPIRSAVSAAHLVLVKLIQSRASTARVAAKAIVDSLLLRDFLIDADTGTSVSANICGQRVDGLVHNGNHEFAENLIHDILATGMRTRDAPGFPIFEAALLSIFTDATTREHGRVPVPTSMAKLRYLLDLEMRTLLSSPRHL